MVDIVAQVKEIDEAIAALERERMRVLRQDTEYAEYLDEFDDRENGKRRLSIQEFQQFQAELKTINERFRQVDPRSSAFDEVWRQNIRRVIELETLLLA